MVVRTVHIHFNDYSQSSAGLEGEVSINTFGD